MCGIVGIWSESGDITSVRPMTERLLHRGPDHTGYFISDDKKMALGHTRLSIIDLSENASQPMVSPDGKYVIVFNGEIYNFRDIRNQIKAKDPTAIFNTGSDTETIIYAYKLWAEDAVNRFEGMFVMAIYDTENKSFFLCRDRMGKKPLYYFQVGNNFIFASELKSLYQHPLVASQKKIDPYAVYSFLHLGYIHEPFSIYAQIKKFPAGCYALLTNPGNIKIEKYWNPGDYLHKNAIDNEGAVIRNLKNHITQAVNKRLVSDRPLGSFLSGGMDSSLITAIASELSPGKFKTFCIGFNDGQFDERKHARAVAEQLDTDHHEYVLSEKEAVGILETYLENFDEPFADTSSIPVMLVSSIAKKEITVALTGDGSDELFLGYGAYDWANRLEKSWVQYLQSTASIILRNSFNSRYKRISHILRKVPDFYLRSHIFSQEQYFFDQEEIQNHLLVHPNNMEFVYTDYEYEDLMPAELQAFFDLNFYLRDDLLVKVDRASMFYSLECRNPFLDHNLVEYALGIPYNFKKRGNASKWIIKEILKDYLPSSVIDHPKWGFSIPLAKWLKNELNYLLKEYLRKEIIESTGLVKFDYVNSLLKNFEKGNDYLYNRLWLLIVLHKWMRSNGYSG